MQISQKRLAEIETFDEKFNDPECPPLTDEQLATAQPLHFCSKFITIDNDIYEALIAYGENYQFRANEILRKELFKST